MFTHSLGRFSILLAALFIPALALGHGMSEAEQQLIMTGGDLSFLWIGMTHMLSGYDHLAFVLGILFLVQRPADIVRYVTAFTLGHSATLIWATYHGIQLSYYLIDAIIALSVCYIAVVNLNGWQRWLGVQAPNMLLMVLGFGLIHGLGLSTRLQSLPLQGDSLLWNILAFNLGVELGQLLALLLMWLLLSLWRRHHSFDALLRLSQVGLIMLGGCLFLFQMHEYSHAESTVVVAAPAPAGDRSATDEASRHALELTIPAQGYKEYKVLQAKGQALSYAWQSDGAALYFDFHGEPAGDKTGFFQSYAIGTDVAASGAVVTPFAGTHGWYWKNESDSAVTVSLDFSGEYILMQ